MKSFQSAVQLCIFILILGKPRLSQKPVGKNVSAVIGTDPGSIPVQFPPKHHVLHCRMQVAPPPPPPPTVVVTVAVVVLSAIVVVLVVVTVIVLVPLVGGHVPLPAI